MQIAKKRIEQYGLKDTHELQLWFSAEMANHLKEKGRRAIFWGDLVYKTDIHCLIMWKFNGGTIGIKKTLHYVMP